MSDLQKAERPPGFFVAAFGIDGALEGIGFQELAQLSSKWLAICDQHLQIHGPAFQAPWGGNLSHIDMKFTSGSGAALVTFSVHGKPAASLALASGQSPSAETEVVQMFVRSLRNVGLVRAAAESSEPFQKILQITERPLMVVIPSPTSNISEQDFALVRELSIHTSGAFFQRSHPLS